MKYHNIYLTCTTEDDISAEDIKTFLALKCSEHKGIKKAEVADMPYQTLHKREIQGA